LISTDALFRKKRLTRPVVWKEITKVVVTNTLDLIAEMTLGWTKQTDDLDTTELTVLGGVRFHLFSRQRRLLLNETLPKLRLVIRDLVRVESRNFQPKK